MTRPAPAGRRLQSRLRPQPSPGPGAAAPGAETRVAAAEAVSAEGLPAPPDLSAYPGLDPAWSRTVRVAGADGTRTWHVLDNGAEPVRGTLLCVHGNPTWSYLWRGLLAAAPAGWRVVAPDQLGMGWSERTPNRPLEQRIADLEALTGALGLTGEAGAAGRVVLVAHDWGGPVGLGWALSHVDRLAGIVLTNTAVAQPSSVAAPLLIRAAHSPALRRLLCVGTPVFVRAAAALSRPPLPAAVRAALQAPYAARAAGLDRSGRAARAAVGDFVADIPLEPDHPTGPVLAGVAARLGELASVPALVLWGPRDPVFTRRHLRDLLHRMPWADVHLYHGASHLVTEDRPEYAGAVRDFVAGLEGPAAREGGQSPVPAGQAAPTSQDGQEHHGQAPAAAAPPLWAWMDSWVGRADPVLVDLAGRRQVSGDRLAGLVRDLAAGLADSGVGAGDRVALLVPPGPELMALVQSCWRIGAVVVVADAGLGVPGLRRAIASADPDHVIAVARGHAVTGGLGLAARRLLVRERSGRTALAAADPLVAASGMPDLDGVLAAGRGRPLPPAPDPDAAAAVVFTSGATGPAKGVSYRQRQVRAQVGLLRAAYGIGPDDRLVAAFAPFALYGPALGIPTAVPDMDVTRPQTLTARALAEAVRAVGGTMVFASPAALRNVVATAGDLTAPLRAALAGVRLVLSAGAPVPAALLRQVVSLMPAAEAHTPYGMTEALPVADISLSGIEAAGRGNGVCVGRPLPGVTVRVAPLDPRGVAGADLSSASGVTGEIVVRAAHVKDSYDRLAVTQRASARPPGWHRTGDVGHLDGGGRLWVEGRLAHVVVTADGPVTPVGLEQRVEQLPGVRAAAVCGVGPAGAAVVVVVVVPERRSRGPLARPELAAAVRGEAGIPVAAVLLADALPVDIRHASKVDRARVGRWAERVLSGGRAGRL